MAAFVNLRSAGAALLGLDLGRRIIFAVEGREDGLVEAPNSGDAADAFVDGSNVEADDMLVLEGLRWIAIPPEVEGLKVFQGK